MINPDLLWFSNWRLTLTHRRSPTEDWLRFAAILLLATGPDSSRLSNWRLSPRYDSPTEDWPRFVYNWRLVATLKLAVDLCTAEQIGVSTKWFKVVAKILIVSKQGFRFLNYLTPKAVNECIIFSCCNFILNLANHSTYFIVFQNLHYPPFCKFLSSCIVTFSPLFLLRSYFFLKTYWLDISRGTGGRFCYTCKWSAIYKQADAH